MDEEREIRNILYTTLEERVVNYHKEFSLYLHGPKQFIASKTIQLMNHIQCFSLKDNNPYMNALDFEAEFGLKCLELLAKISDLKEVL